MIQKTRGFTIIELMTTVAVLGVIAAIAVPSIGNLMRKNELTASANDLFSSISIARSEAIKNKTDVTLEPLGGNWANGWRVMANAQEIDKTGPISGGFNASSQADKGSITFGPNGYTKVPNPWGAGDGVKAKIVSVNTAGSITVKDSSC
jgi:type IV fimbrial biogenesis protein FimT